SIRMRAKAPVLQSFRMKSSRPSPLKSPTPATYWLCVTCQPPIQLPHGVSASAYGLPEPSRPMAPMPQPLVMTKSLRPSPLKSPGRDETWSHSLKFQPPAHSPWPRRRVSLNRLSTSLTKARPRVPGSSTQVQVVEPQPSIILSACGPQVSIAPQLIPEFPMTLEMQLPMMYGMVLRWKCQALSDQLP